MIFDELDSLESARTKIKVIGVGGAGKNAIDHMIENDVHGVDFIAVNTDAQDLKYSKAKYRLLIGRNTTRGHGAGANPDVGRMAALESEEELREIVSDADMVFITCGMGGGTGTGAAPVIAKVARENNCLTVGICTKPFLFEGPERMNNAVAGLTALREYVDTLIVIPNQRLMQIVDPSTPMLEAYREADNVLRKGVQGIAEIISMPGMINVDFADVRHVMANSGTALMGIGAASGPDRAIEAARKAIHSSLLEVTIDGATDAIVNFTASENLAAKEVETALAEIRNNCDKDLNIIYGTAYNNDLGDEMIVTVVATGYELKAQSNGYDELANEIYKNISEENIEYEGLSSHHAPQPEHEEESSNTGSIDDIFDIKRNKKMEKMRLKEEKRLKKAGEQTSEESSELKQVSKKKYPSWLTK
ncbi:MAG: cell division protein FtsZ [Anaeroplasmataceae bacterium]|nr:cell division protein FtsZ [Anaeroplasmataceae bacterium]